MWEKLKQLARRYDEVRRDLKSSPTLLARFEQCGVVPRDEMRRIGGVGQAAPRTRGASTPSSCATSRSSSATATSWHG